MRRELGQSGTPGVRRQRFIREIFLHEYLAFANLSRQQKAFANLGDSETPTFFKRYVDDIFAIVKVCTEERFLEHLNSLFPDNIVLTFEKETNNLLPFLDALVIRRGTAIVTKVYRKATSSDRYLNFASHHHISTKTGIISTMVDRAVSICDPRYLISELSYIKRTFLANGYPRALITSVMKRRLQNPRRPKVNEEVPKPLIVLPYYHNIGEQIKRLGKALNFWVYFKSSPNLRALLRTDKTKVPFDSIPGAVYQITCACNASYIGETGKTLIDRFNEHMAAITRYRNAEDRLHGRHTVRTRGRPQTKDPRKTMEEAIKASAAAEN
uniref:GIY-YIG domain-containing protein n=1 Tax=Trichuris muris TaxID=70415 RepID=A0A5S6QHF9_TRIMR